MERGFKARCEQMAKSLRLAIGIGPTDPLNPLRLARFLNVHVLSLDEIGLSKADFRQLAFADSDSWSAITVTGFWQGGNNSQSKPHWRATRQQRDA